MSRGLYYELYSGLGMRGELESGQEEPGPCYWKGWAPPPSRSSCGRRMGIITSEEQEANLNSNGHARVRRLYKTSRGAIAFCKSNFGYWLHLDARKRSDESELPHASIFPQWAYVFPRSFFGCLAPTLGSRCCDSVIKCHYERKVPIPWRVLLYIEPWRINFLFLRRLLFLEILVRVSEHLDASILLPGR